MFAHVNFQPHLMEPTTTTTTTNQDNIRFIFISKIPRFTSWSSKLSRRLNFDSFFLWYQMKIKLPCPVWWTIVFLCSLYGTKTNINAQTNLHNFITIFVLFFFSSLLLYSCIRIYMCRGNVVGLWKWETVHFGEMHEIYWARHVCDGDMMNTTDKTSQRNKRWPKRNKKKTEKRWCAAKCVYIWEKHSNRTPITLSRLANQFPDETSKWSDWRERIKWEEKKMVMTEMQEKKKPFRSQYDVTIWMCIRMFALWPRENCEREYLRMEFQLFNVT